MKKLITALLLLLSVTTVIAQIQITGTDMPGAGRINLVYIDTTSTPDIGTASATAQNWDFSSLNFHYPQVASYSPVTAYQAYGPAFPDANLYTYGPSYLYAGFFGGAPVDVDAWGYMYWRSDSNGFYICGFRVDYGIGEQNITETPQEMLMGTPASLDSSFTNSSRWMASFANNPFDADTHYTSNVYKTLECDAYGQMVTATLGTLDVLRVHETMIKLDSITGTIGTINIYAAEIKRDTVNNYYFWANGIGYPVAIVKANALDSILSVEYLYDTLAGFTVTGTVYKNNGSTPVETGKAELIAKTALDQLYGVPETVPLTAGGHFQFSNIVDGGNFLVQAKPDTSSYPYDVPTYYGDAIYWIDAHTLAVQADTGIAIRSASDSLGYASTGGGSISGTIWQNLGGAKTLEVSGGVKVTLEQNPSGSVVRHTYTDADGRYTFKDLPAVDFRLHVDIAAIPMDSTYYLLYSAGDTTTTDLDFYYDSLYIYIYNTSGVASQNANNHEGVIVYPNPATQQITLAFYDRESVNTNIAIYDLFGRMISEKELLTGTGENMIVFDVNDYKPGIYFIKISDANYSSMVKFIKQ